MSKENKNVDGQEVDPNDNQEVDDQDTNNDIENLTPEQIKELLEENSKLKSKTSRLENEAKEYKGKYQTQKQKEEAEEKARLTKEGKTEELLAKEQQEKEAIKERLVKTTSRALRDKLENSVLRLAPDAYDVEDIISNLDKELYSFDTESMTVDGVKEAVAAVRKLKPHLFNSKIMPNSVNNNPKTFDDKKGKIYTHEEYKLLPKAEKLKALGEKRVEGF